MSGKASATGDNSSEVALTPYLGDARLDALDERNEEKSGNENTRKTKMQFIFEIKS